MSKIQSVPAIHIKSFLEAHPSITQTQLGKMLGVSGSAVSHWIKDDRAPKWTLLAFECFTRRKRSQNTADSILLIKIPNHHRQTIETIVGSLGGSLKAIDLGNIIS